VASSKADILDVSSNWGGGRLTSSTDCVGVGMRARAKGARVDRPALSANIRRPALVKQRMLSDRAIQPPGLQRRGKVAGVNKKSEFFFICSSGGTARRR
jgi:hypothetical protein